MTKARVQLFKAPNKSIVVDTDATVGATLGVNLYNPDGSLVTIDDLTAPSTPVLANQVSTSGSSYTDSQAINASMAPLTVADGTTFLIPSNKQVLFTIPIELLGAGTIEADGALVEVT